MVLTTERLHLTALTLEALQGWVDGDAERLREETGALFPSPPGTPPLFGDDLPSFRDRMAETPEELGWWVWLAARRRDEVAVGVCGLGGRPDLQGSVVLGYSIYPEHEGCGYATEAARAVTEWALGQPGVRRVRATVPVGNVASGAVARKVGMVPAGSDHDPRLGAVAVYERTRAT